MSSDFMSMMGYRQSNVDTVIAYMKQNPHIFFPDACAACGLSVSDFTTSEIGYIRQAVCS